MCEHTCNCHTEMYASGLRTEAELKRLANEEATTKVIEKQFEYWRLAVENMKEQNRFYSVMRARIQPSVWQCGKAWIASHGGVSGVGDTPEEAVNAYYKTWHEGDKVKGCERWASGTR